MEFEFVCRVDANEDSAEDNADVQVSNEEEGEICAELYRLTAPTFSMNSDRHEGMCLFLWLSLFQAWPLCWACWPAYAHLNCHGCL